MVGVKVERPQRSEDDDLDASEGRRMLGRVDEAEKCCGSTHVGLASVVRVGSPAARVGRAGAQPYLGARTISGDMMMDGVPGVRVFPVRAAAAHSEQDVHPLAGDNRAVAGADREHQWVCGQRHANLAVSGCLADRVGRGQRGIAELAQRVIAAAQHLALHRQGGTFAVLARRDLPVVGVIR